MRGCKMAVRAPSSGSTLCNLIEAVYLDKPEVGALLILPSHLLLSQDGDRGLYTSKNTRLLKIA